MREWEVWDRKRVKHYIKHYGKPVKAKGKHEVRMKLAASLIEGDSILDVGCGVGHLYPYVRHLDYLGVDNSIPMLEQARKSHPNARFMKADIYNLSATPEMDTVVCQSLLIHLPDTDEPIRQLWSRTRKRLVISTPLGNRESIREVKNIRGRTLLLHTRTSQQIQKLLPNPKYHPEPKTQIGNTYITAKKN